MSPYQVPGVWYRVYLVGALRPWVGLGWRPFRPYPIRRIFLAVIDRTHEK